MCVTSISAPLPPLARAGRAFVEPCAPARTSPPDRSADPLSCRPPAGSATCSPGSALPSSPSPPTSPTTTPSTPRRRRTTRALVDGRTEERGLSLSRGARRTCNDARACFLCHCAGRRSAGGWLSGCAGGEASAALCCGARALVPRFRLFRWSALTLHELVREHSMQLQKHFESELKGGSRSLRRGRRRTALPPLRSSNPRPLAPTQLARAMDDDRDDRQGSSAPVIVREKVKRSARAVSPSQPRRPLTGRRPRSHSSAAWSLRGSAHGQPATRGTCARRLSTTHALATTS